MSEKIKICCGGINEKSFFNLIRTGNYNEAKELASHWDLDEMENLLLEYSFDTEDIGVYTLLNIHLLDQENGPIHHVISVIMSMAFSHWNGAYQVAFYHAKKAVELDPENLDFKEYMLFFYEIPDQLLSKDEAISLAKEILKQRPIAK
ncbi:hypothetical protein [Paludifilum halophilum]|uniref:Uncharacterized protein n=1 Tax=Paludifilum halophilum TaxID=1642702 RepID=A0A235B2T3_9BACL|nr:hypothetical protein [Paludifilum halophilum]OYD06594.1 hypothetical protein CHM34_16000 [Paludifilum halophilum]